MNYKIGDVVRSMAGHDKGIYYVVVAVDNNYAMVANGKTRDINDPKRKKQKHLEYVGFISSDAVNSIEYKLNAFAPERKTGNSELRKILNALGYSNSKIMIER